MSWNENARSERMELNWTMYFELWWMGWSWFWKRSKWSSLLPTEYGRHFCNGLDTIFPSRPILMSRLTLKNKNLIIRPVAPRDRSRFLDGLNQISKDTLFMRFLSPNRQLSSSQVDYLLNVDFVDHFAFAVVLDEPSYPGMAITRYIRSYENPKEAEWAVTVVDCYQGLGLGRILLYLMNLVSKWSNWIHSSLKWINII